MQELKLEALIAMFDSSVRARIEELAADPETTGLVVFENQQMDSSHFGDRSVMCVGPNRTYKTVEECEGRWLNDLPSQRKYATAFWRKEVTQ